MSTFRVKSQLTIERDLALAIEQIVAKEGSKSVLVLVDEHVEKHPEVVRMMEMLGKRGRAELCAVPSGEPTTVMVNDHVAKYGDWGADFLVGIGGGSVIDFTKALSAMLVHKGRVEEYHGTGVQLTRGIRKAAVATTAGTGCDVTAAAVLINPAIHFKRGVIGPATGADYSVICGSLSTSLPRDITTLCAMDAIAHAVESFVSKTATIVSRMYSKQAFLLLYETLPKVLEDPENVEYREKMCLGSTLAGYAIDNANTGACHGISYAPGVHFRVPHGSAIAMMFVEAMRINVEKGCHTYAELYRAIPGAAATGSDEADARAFVELMAGFGPLVAYRKRLSDYGAQEKDIEILADKAIEFQAALVTNPVGFGREDAIRVFRSIF